MCHQHDHATTKDQPGQAEDHHGHHHGHGHGHHASGEHQHGHAHHPAPAEPTDTDELAECPVMPGSMTVKADAQAAGLVREYDGKTYYLCCAACGPAFDADPARYAGTAA